MPFSRLTIYPAPDEQTSTRLASSLTGLIERILSKKAPLTSVLVETPAAVRWTLGSEPLRSTAVLEVNVTESTNSEADKAAFIAEAHATLCDHVPDLNDVCYVIIREIPASAWGYDGMTQAQRSAMSTG